MKGRRKVRAMDCDSTYHQHISERPTNSSFQEAIKGRVELNGTEEKELVSFIPSSFSVPVPRPSPEFVKRFERKYGKGAIATFIRIIEKVSSNLSDVARTFGFTREYARHIYKNIYGVSYSEMRQAKLRLRRQARAEKNEKEGKDRPYLKEIGSFIHSVGLDYELRKRARFYFHLSNGKTVGMRRCKSPLRIGNVYYYRFNNFAWSPDEFDFLVLRCEGKARSTHYVIPHQFMPRRIVSLNPESPRAHSKYSRFKEAWHLLAGHKERSVAAG